MTTIKTEKGKLIAVKVPKGARDFILHGPLINNYLLYYEADGYVVNKYIEINGKIIGLLSDLTEQQAEEFVDYIEPVGESSGGYLNYAYPIFGGMLTSSAIISLKTLLYKNEINAAQPILLIKKN